jgi:hypothetical protein
MDQNIPQTEETKAEAASKKAKAVAKRNAPKKKEKESDSFAKTAEDRRRSRIIPFDISTALSCFVLLLMTQ